MPPLSKKPGPKPEIPTSLYALHPRLKVFFEEFVVEPFEKHEATKAWMREVMKQDWGYQASLTDNGRSSFAEAKNGLPPEDLVLIYCYRYMQMHTVSGFHMYYRNLQEHKLKMIGNPIFIDFGCGPLTGAVALAWYNFVANNTATGSQGLRVHYIGIDRSEAMLAHAQRASVTGELFHSKSTFDFALRNNAQQLVPALIEKFRKADGKEQLTVVLNCSYYFGSRTLEVKPLINLIKGWMSKHLSEDKVCLLYQNASHSAVNEKWEQFKKGMAKLLPPHSAVEEQIGYYDVTGRKDQFQPQRIKLRRELLVNQTWKDQLEEKK